MHRLLARTAFAVVAMMTAIAAFADTNAVTNHSMNVVGTPVFTPGSVSFVATPTQASSLNRLMTGQVCVGSSVYNGSTFTFTSVGQQNTFVVSFPSGAVIDGQTVTISLTDASTATCNNGAEGYLSTFVANVLSTVPTTSTSALLLLAALLLGGFFVTSRGRGHQ